jgi:ribosomal protein S18 acetylase RimI-like enzyme
MLRHARLEDAGAVATVLLESRRAFLSFAPSPHSEDDIRQWVRDVLLPGGRVVVWEEHGHIVGVLATSEDEGSAWIDQLYLLPGFLRQGIGSKLLTYAHGILRRPIRLYIFQQNDRAKRFYERHGYKPIEFTNGQGNEEKCPDVLYELQVPDA